MDTITLTLPKEYGYVILTVVSSFVLSTYHVFVTGRTRGAAQVPYPHAYAATFALPAPGDSKTSAQDLTKMQAEYRFNCAQRAHANYLEQMPIFLPALVISGLKWPVVSSALGAFWVLSRLLYLQGYVYGAKEKGKGRYRGIGYYPVNLVLIGMAAKVGIDMVFG